MGKKKEQELDDNILFVISYDPNVDEVMVIENESELFTSNRERTVISSTLASELGKKLARISGNRGKCYAALGMTVQNLIKAFNEELSVVTEQKDSDNTR